MSQQHITIRILRGRVGHPAQYHEYPKVPISPSATILSALEYIRSHLDNSLIFQRSCWHGSCGTCALVSNGIATLACLEPLPSSTPLTLAPLAALPLWADLATQRRALYANFPLNARYLTTHRHPKKSGDQSPQQLENCIECGICEHACPIRGGFMGPAALSAHYREIINRPEREKEILEAVKGSSGASGCQRHLHCSRHCPASVYPSGDILKLQRKLNESS